METQAITVRLPKDLYEWLRRTAFEQRTPQNGIIVEALTEKRDQEGRAGDG